MAARYTAKQTEFPGEWMVWDTIGNREAGANRSNNEAATTVEADRLNQIYQRWIESKCESSHTIRTSVVS